MTVTSYQQALDWLYSFVRFDKERRTPGSGDLRRMEALLARLGSPQARFPSVLIAGTKGKGSTAAMIASILRAAGYRTGLYTSPHLHTFRERVRVDDTLITRAEVVAGTRRLEELVREFPDVIWFELVTALAFMHLAGQQIDIAVLEVGLGGRLDPTNVVRPQVAALTPISYDHTEILGSTLEAIAQEKAGIIKPDVPVVVAPQPPEARQVVEAVARERGAPLIQVGRDWSWEQVSTNLSGQRFRVRGPGLPVGEFSIPLLGRHQLLNATTAVAVAHELTGQGWKIPAAALEAGLARVEWPVRFELLARDPLIVADGAHNRASALELRLALDSLLPGRRVHLVFGASNDKDIEGILSELLGPELDRGAGGQATRAAVETLLLTHSRHVRATPTQLLRGLAAQYPVVTVETEDVEQALQAARGRAGPEDVICVTGSLFICAEARALLLSERGVRVESDDDLIPESTPV